MGKNGGVANSLKNPERINGKTLIVTKYCGEPESRSLKSSRLEEYLIALHLSHETLLPVL